MKVAFAALARYAEVDPKDGLVNVTAMGLDVFGVRELPAKISLALVLQLRYPEAEAGESREITLVTRGPDTQLVGKQATFPVAPTIGEYHAPGWEGIFHVAGGIELAVEKPGGHSLSLQVDGLESAYVPFQVFLATD